MVPASALRFKPTAAMLGKLTGENAEAAPTCAGIANCGTLWVYDGSAIRGVTVRTGISTGTATEIAGPAIAEGDAVVTAITLPAASSKTVTSATSSSSSTTRSPLLGGSPPPPPPSGGMGSPR
jgi:hypothetical protein